MKRALTKYFWHLNERALGETAAILRDPGHPRFAERMVTLLSRCDRPKEVFSLLSREAFVTAWPRIKKRWQKMGGASDFQDWWQTLYEEIAQRDAVKQRTPRGRAAASLLKVGRMVKAARIRSGLSQRELAVRVGMKQPDISMVEAGRANITMETLTTLCRVLQITQIKL